MSQRGSCWLLHRWVLPALIVTASASMANNGQDTDARARALGAELRCLVCQNQTIQDSNAALAVDLRQQIREQITAGRSDEQIRAYMVERFGDFILYDTPLKRETFLLWFLPFVLLGIGALIVRRLARRARERTPVLPPESRQLEAVDRAWQEQQHQEPRMR